MPESILLVLIPVAVIAIVFVVFKKNKKEPEKTLDAKFGGHGKTRTR